MTIRQLSIFLQNQPGSLHIVTGCLKDANINIRALSVAESSDFGLLRLVVDDTDKAIRSLENVGMVVKTSPVVAIEIPDRPGGLHDILGELAAAGINIDYIYAFASSNQEKAMVLVKFNDNDRASKILAEQNVHVWSEAEIAQL